MQLEIARPWALLLLPVLAGIIIWFARGFRSRSKTRRIGETLMRCLVMALAVLAIAGVSIKKSSDITTTIFLVDMSDSVKSMQSDESSFIQSAIAQMPDKNQAGIVVFGADAQIEQFVSEKKVFTSFQSEVTKTATNLEQAVQTALALFPNESARRLVLLTDGSENEGNINDLASSFAGSDVELKVVKYDSYVDKEVYVSDVSLPDVIHQGDQFQVKVEVYSTEATGATVSLYSGRTLKGQKDVVLQKGSNQLVFSDEGVEGGLKSYRVTVEAEQDTVSVNNTYSAFTTVEARPKLLVVEGAKNEGNAFTPILDACNYDYDVVTPSGVPGQISDMTQYQSVILLDVYADDLRRGFMETLETYVKDYAGGIIAVGGENSFALGNYRNTPLETVLPVSMDLEGEKQVPKLAMAMVIDHSGSMSSPSTADSSISCMEIAKQAAVNSLDSLREIDEVGVLAFDDAYTWSVPLQEAASQDEIIEKISGIGAAGGTSIYPALAEAVKKIKDSDAVLKHIVLLTDGQDGFHQYEDVLETMEENGITLSTVAVGQGADSNTLEWLAEEGGGRYYYSDASTTLPRIFAQEVYLSAKSYLINEEFTPVIVNSHEIIKGIFTKGSPSLLGYIAATPKPTATVILESDREDPILTVWQYGLGKTVAWNSDGTGEWTRNFAGWDNYAALWRNIIDWTISSTDLGKDSLQVKQEASSAIITYQTSDYSADTSISAVVTGEDGEQKQVTLKAAAPGVYSAEVPLDEAGVYSINVRNQNGEEIIKNINTATAMQYSREYRYAEMSGDFDEFVEKASGRYITDFTEVFDTELDGAMSRTDITQWLLLAAIIFFALDVIIRRMHIDWLAGISRGFGNITGRIKSSVIKNRESGSRQIKSGETKEPDMAAGTAVRESRKNVKESGQRVKETRQCMEESGQRAKETRQHTKEETRRRMKGKKTKSASADTGAIDTAALLKKKKERDL